MKPLATVHWTVRDKEHSANAYTESELAEFTTNLQKAKVPYHTCLLSLDISIPIATKPIKEVV